MPTKPASFAMRRSNSAVGRSALERATSVPTDDTFLKFCQVHGHEVAEEHRSSLPLNRLSMNSDSSFSSMDGSSSHSQSGRRGLAAKMEWKLHSAADQASAWLDQLGAPSHHGRRASVCRIHPLGPHARTLQYSQNDILKVAMDDETFQRLKNGLRKRGVITNNYLRENLHFYVQHIKKVEQKKEVARRQASLSPMGRNAAA